MSAFVSITYRDSIRLLTDGAVYTKDGVLQMVKRKVWASDLMPMAVTGRGSAAATEIVSRLFPLAGAFTPDKSVDQTLPLIQELFDKFAEKGGFPKGQEAEFLIAAWSETQGPVQYYVTSTVAAGYNEGVEPFRLTLVDTPVLVAGGSPEIAADWAAAGITDETMGYSSEAAREHGVEIMEVMRRRPGPNPIDPSAPWLFGIGGQVDLTTVTADGVTIDTIHTWPDRIGEKISPAGAILDEPIAKGNRRERRAAAKQRRKELACA